MNRIAATRQSARAKRRRTLGRCLNHKGSRVGEKRLPGGWLSRLSPTFSKSRKTISASATLGASRYDHDGSTLLRKTHKTCLHRISMLTPKISPLMLGRRASAMVVRCWSDEGPITYDVLLDQALKEETSLSPPTSWRNRARSRQ